MNNVKAFLTDVNRDGFHEVAEAILANGRKDAEDINYVNTTSGLESDNVQDAIDEVAGDVGDLVTAVNGISGDVDDLETAVGGISDDVSDLQTAVSGKVSKSGDTMSGVLNVQASNGTPLHIKRTDTSGNVYMGFENADGEVGSYIVGGDKKPYFKPEGGSNTRIVLDSDLPYMYQRTLNTFDGATSLTYEGCPTTYRVPALLIGNGNYTPYFAMIMYDTDGGNPNGFIITSLTGQTLSISATLVSGKWNITIGNLAPWGNYKLIVFN